MKESEGDKPRLPPLLDLPYAARQRIVIVDDEVAAAERAAWAASTTPEKVPMWRQVVNELKPGKVRKEHVIQSIPVGLAGGFWGVGGLAAALLAQLAVTETEGIKAAREAGLPVLTVGRAEAAGLDFPVGHPLDSVVYIGDPAYPSLYYPAAHFHRSVFEQKFAEAVRLLMALRATRFSVRWEQGWGRELAAQLDVPLKMLRTKPKVGLDQRESGALLFEATLAPGNPALPDDLAWYHNEPGWRRLAEGRLEHGLQTVDMSVRYTDDLGITAEFAAKVQKAGLAVGGSFQKHASTIWRIQAEFTT